MEKSTGAVKEFKSQYDGTRKEYELTKESTEKIKGKYYSRTFWTQKEGEMSNGSPEVLEFLCLKEQEEQVIHYETLKTECLERI